LAAPGGRGGMRKILTFVLLLLGASFPSFSQQSFVEQSLVLNVEVPVRVFDGAIFVTDLTIDDFEISEDGVPQKIEACYLVKKSAIQRREEKKHYVPETNRNYYLFFEITDYESKIGEALDYFVQNILIPSDRLVVITPIKTYRMKEQALQAKTRKAVAEELKGMIRKDCLAGNAEFRNAVTELTALAKSLSTAIRTGSSEEVEKGVPVPEESNQNDISQGRIEGMHFNEQLVLYETLLGRLDTLREINQMKLTDFANHLSTQDGQKYVFLFYQREYIPQIDPKLIAEYLTYHQTNPYVYQVLSNVSKFRDREILVDVDKIKQVYADASTAIHFLFLTTPRPDISGVYLQESSDDIFSTFREMAQATGGFFDGSSNAAALFQKALEAAENYYLLYYSPKKVEDTGDNFRKIEVRVKKGNYHLVYRTGYFSRY
jgi:VWFA-related protein